MNEIAYKSKEIANECFKNFCNLIDLNPELYEHLYNIPMKIGETEGLAEYKPNENIIIINGDYIIELIDEYGEDENVVLNIAFSLIHEMIHANRTIMIEGGLNALNIKKTDDELLLYGQKKMGYDVEEFVNILSEIINKPYTNDLKKYIPIKVKINKNGSYTVIAFNRETNCFDEFDNHFFNAKMEKDIDKFFHDIGIELEHSHRVTKTIYTKTNGEKDRASVINDYYMPYNKNGKLIQNHEMDHNISTKKFASILDSKTEYVLNRMENSNGFEETLTETLALIIMLTRKDNYLDLDAITTKIIEKDKSADITMAATLIQRMGIDMIKWYMLSAYSEFYDDELERTFKERYDDLLLDFNDLYESGIYEEHSKDKQGL